ncbi:MAG: hypothetical protein D6693_06830 [Planctomycetota bacterium]|nr:MAG: hypothetical protein D6693_06830 [Planctomycetota bacterium]
MPTITINGVACEFTPGQTVLQVATANGIDIPHYCYHEGLSIVASCRICLAEVWAPNPRNDNALEPIPKLLPTCQIQAQDGQHVYTDSPRATANQKAVMEYLLVNHPLDCPVCDQAGECKLQDYSYEHGRGVSRFEETKVKQPKKDVGPNVLLYSDRCIMCTRCVRFTREVTGTNELIVQGRGNKEQIDLFPGKALDNPLASNVIDLCPVGALLDKDFLFKKRVWDLTSSPSVDGITSSGDNLWIDHADGRVYRVRPRTNLEVNLWWITDEVRYGWKHVHSEDRLATPKRRQHGARVETEWPRAIAEAVRGVRRAVDEGRRLAVLLSPMLTSEEAFLLAETARAFDPDAILGLGPVPTVGEDRAFPPSRDGEPVHQSPRSPSPGQPPRPFIMRAEKCPNARGVRRVIEGIGATPLDVVGFVTAIKDHGVGAVILTGNYPSAWSTPDLRGALAREGLFVVLADTLDSPLVELTDVVLPAATWVEKAGTFENAEGRLQSFEAAIRPVAGARAEGQIALDLHAELEQERAKADGAGGSPAGVTPKPARLYDAAATRRRMAEASDALRVFITHTHQPPAQHLRQTDMPVVEV